MRGFEQDHLHALCIPGVQNTPMDWQLLQDATSEFLDIDIADEQPLASKNIPAEDWRKEVIQYERSVAQAHNADVILAHSYGTHRALEILQQTESARIAFLLCPASNIMQKKSASIERGIPVNATVIQDLMRDVSLDMTDETFINFCIRHEARYQQNMQHIKTQFRYLTKGASFAWHLQNYSGEKPVIIFKSEDDPWHEQLPKHDHVTEVKLPENTGHYPHITQANFIANEIHGRLIEFGILTNTSQTSQEHALVTS